VVDDDVGRERLHGRPLIIQQAPHQRAHMVQELQPSAEAMAACNRRLAFRRGHKIQKLTGKRRKAQTAPSNHCFELDGRSNLQVMTTSGQFERQGHMGLDVTSRAERLDRNAHFARPVIGSRCATYLPMTASGTSPTHQIPLNL
jgi:hypothetical protein